METLLVVAQHRNQYYGKVKADGAARFASGPSRAFRGINCRTFQSGAGILPTPFKPGCTYLTKHSSSSSSSSSSPKTPSSTIKCLSNSHFVDDTHYKITPKSSPIPINVKVLEKETPFDEELDFSNENLPFSELWAGPAYSNSPPPSSLPIPKFSMRPKRTVSLNLPVFDSGVKVHPIAKSAPTSPTREHNSSTRDLFLSADSATRTLRRILNLDAADE